MTAAKKPSRKTAKTKRARARNASMLEGPFSIGDLEFRAFSAITPVHVAALGIDEELQALADAGDETDDGWLRAIFGVAWTLHAPLDVINDLCFEIEEADSDEEREALRKEYRRQLYDFRAGLSLEAVEELAGHINRIFTRHMALEFETEERDKGNAVDGEKKSPGAES